MVIYRANLTHAASHHHPRAFSSPDAARMPLRFVECLRSVSRDKVVHLAALSALTNMGDSQTRDDLIASSPRRMSPPVTFQARRLLRNRWLLALAAAPLLLYIPLLASLALGTRGQLLLLLHPLLFAAASVFGVARKNPRPRTIAGSLRIEATEVVLPDETRVPRSEIEQGFVTAGPDGQGHVTLFGPRIPITLQLDSEEEGHALLAALGLDAGQAAATFRGQSRAATLSTTKRAAGLVVAWLPSLLLIVFGILRAPVDHGLSSPGMLSLLAGVLMVFVPLAPLSFIARPARIAVGVDGVEIVWLGRRRFIPFGRITSVEALKPTLGAKFSHGVALVLEDGERVALPLSTTSLVEGEARRLEERIEQARKARASAANGAEILHLAVSDGEALVTALRRAGTGAAAGPRDPATDPERLVATLEDASATASARAQAAIALCSDGHEASRARTLRAARQVASPRLRVAFERAAEPEVEQAALVEALAALEDEERVGSARRR